MNADKQNLIIAICGLKRSGKDTIAKYISEKYQLKHVKISDTLKNSIQLLFNIDKEDLEYDAKDIVNTHWNVSPRKIMDFIGTHVFQYEIQKIIPNIGRNFWIDNLLKKESKNNIVISDLRFIHEFEEIKKLNSKTLIIRVVRDCTSTNGLASEIEQEHIPADITFNNNGSIKDLYQSIDKYFNDNRLTDSKILDVYTDGSCFGNPGKGGWGVYIPSIHNGEYWGGTNISTTNNIMELLAIEKAFEFILDLCKHKTYTELNVYTDSNYVKNGITKWMINWKANGWMTKDKQEVKHKDKWLSIDSKLTEIKNKHNINIIIHWIKAHSKNPYNDHVDKLAKRFHTKL